MMEIEKKESRYSTPDKIELRSEEVQDILSKPPKWIIRYGITVIFIIIAFIFVGSYFFKYPDIVSGTITVMTANVPADITSKTTGRIDSLFVKEKQYIHKGDFIAVIENTASLNDIEILKKSLRQYDINNPVFIDKMKEFKLGTVQGSYASFVKTHKDYVYFIQTDYYHKKEEIAKKQLQAQIKMIKQMQESLKLSRQSFESSKKVYKIDSLLFVKKAMSLTDYQASKQVYLQVQQSFASAMLNIETQKTNLLQLEQNIFDLEQQYMENYNQLKTALSSSYEQLLNDIKTWEQTYLLISPIDGIVTMTTYWQTNQNINGGDVLATIVPRGNKKIIGKILLPSSGIGKVKKGQIVNVKFDNYPYMEFGMVKVKIKNISLVPIINDKNKYYMLEVDFPNKIISNYGKELKFKQQMQGKAEIITDDLRLIDKFIDPIKSIIKK